MTALQFLEPVAQHLDTCRVCQHTEQPCPTAAAIFDAVCVLAAQCGVHLIPPTERTKNQA